eukprot:61520-Prymnesium_polylepis.1
MGFILNTGGHGGCGLRCAAVERARSAISLGSRPDGKMKEIEEIERHRMSDPYRRECTLRSSDVKNCDGPSSICW